MTVSVGAWLKDILPHTPGIVRSVAKREFVLACREFYRETFAWREVVESTFLAAGDYAYQAVPEDDTTEVVQILSVEVNGLPIDGTKERPLGERPTGTPTRWYPTGPDTFEVWPTPDQYDADIRVRVALLPKDTITALPDFAHRKHYDALIAGALGRILGHPAKPYSNPSLAQYYMNRFRNMIGEFSAEAKRGGFGGQNWRFPGYGK